MLDDTIMNVTLPSLVRQLGATTSQLQWIVDAFTLVFAGLLLAAEAWRPLRSQAGAPDRLGAVRHVLGPRGCGFAVGSTDRCTRPHGHRGGPDLPDHTGDPVERVHRHQGTSPGNRHLVRRHRRAVALGPIAGGFLLEHFWWGSVLLINVPICAIAIFLGWKILPNSKDADAPRLDIGGLVLSIVAVGTLVYTVSKARRSAGRPAGP